MHSFSVERNQIIHRLIKSSHPTFHRRISSLLPVAVDCTLVVEGSEAIWALKELALGPAQVVRLDVHRARVLVLELPLTHRAGHR